MLKLSPFWLCTNSVPTDDLEEALDIAAKFGFKYVEIAAIEGSCEHIKPELVNDEYVNEIKTLLDQRDIRCIAVSAHCDMTDDVQFSRFMKKLEFACKIGADYINTRCGNKAKYDKLAEHLDTATSYSEKYGVRINLESYGDLIGDARHSFPEFEKLARPLGYNYDPGNLYRFARGGISFTDDIASADLKYLASIHMKDAVLKDGYIVHTPIGEGGCQFGKLFIELEKKRDCIPAGLEVPQTFRVRAEDFVTERLSVPVKQGEEFIMRSLEMIKRCCETDMR